VQIYEKLIFLTKITIIFRQVLKLNELFRKTLNRKALFPGTNFLFDIAFYLLFLPENVNYFIRNERDGLRRVRGDVRQRHRAQRPRDGGPVDETSVFVASKRRRPNQRNRPHFADGR
jgi:hypothetical protein